MLKRIPKFLAIALVVGSFVNVSFAQQKPQPKPASQPKPTTAQQQPKPAPSPAKPPMRPPSSGASDAMFKKITDTILSQFWSWNPTWATTVGNHRYDEFVDVPSKSKIGGKLINYRNWLKTVELFSNKDLSPSVRMDYNIMRNQLKYAIWQLDTFQSYKWNPSEYNLGQAFDLTLSNPNKRLHDKVQLVNMRLAYIPQYYAAAQQNLDRPTKEHLDLAIQQINGSLEVFDKIIPDSLAKLTDEPLKAGVTEQLGKATQAIKRYVKFLEDYKKSPTSQYRDFRIGKEMYDRKFDYELQSRYTAVQIYERALIRKKQIQEEMQKLTTKLWSKYYGKQPMPTGIAAVQKMIDTLSAQHCKREDFMDCIKTMLPKQEAFLKDKDLLTPDPTKPLVVRVTPPYMEGSGAGASINDPGPYDPNGKTYYNVSLLTGYTPEQAESFLREYNDYILQILNIHEAIPGHYTQLVYANRSPSIIKSVFGNGAMIEGWAVYTERMMLEEGYGPATDEMWLMYYKWHLRSVMNTILDYSIQCLNMNEADAKKLMVNEGFQQQAEADGKWKRATLSQVQLCYYFTGFTEIYDLRDELKKKQGDKFNLKDFHEKFLSYGSAPVKYIREAMLADVADKP